MAALRRFSSRHKRLDHAFLNDRLRNAKSYDRIAGYFRSSIFELVGEEIAGIPRVRVVCNSELDARDVLVAKDAARETALKAVWNEKAPEVEALLHRERYRRLHDLLSSGRVSIRVVPKDRIFIHGKAGVIKQANGKKTSFLGSINETKNAFTSNYELLWEDPSKEGVAWVQDEFDALWDDARPLPEAIIKEIGRIANRVRVYFDDVATKDLPAAALAEAPIYRGGEQLQPWQRSFVTTFLEHREVYGKARLLLADEVGVGKTLSLAASALVSIILGDGPVLLLCPRTLCEQWQVEMVDKLGVPSAVWSSQKKLWIDSRGYEIRGRGAEDIARCPLQIGIVSTGLIVHGSEECEHLLRRKYGMVILDEAHNARSHAVSVRHRENNNLLNFLLEIASRTRHLLLGTATPIQTEVSDLWDLLCALNRGADFVLGDETHSIWPRLESVLPLIKGSADPKGPSEAWDLLRDPLPPAREGALFTVLRRALQVPDDTFISARGYGSLEEVAKMQLRQALAREFFRKQNPVVRHTVLRRRRVLEEKGYMEPVAVNVHPDPDAPPGTYRGVTMEGIGLVTNHTFALAYEAAEAFSTALRKRTKAAGFMKTMLLQRICSSFASGRATATRLGQKRMLDEDELPRDAEGVLDDLTPEEARHLTTIVEELSRPDAVDPKARAVHHFLTRHRCGSDQKTWLEHGCIVFSQYYDTVQSLAEELTQMLPGEAIGVYAGANKSRIYKGGQGFARTEREDIKAAVRDREIRLLVATDAACEGLNLQALGTMINVDLPWNPSRLEQRLGRIKRFGQRRQNVDMLNLVYHDTQDEVVYKELSRRMKDKYDIFGSLPDAIEG